MPGFHDFITTATNNRNRKRKQKELDKVKTKIAELTARIAPFDAEIKTLSAVKKRLDDHIEKTRQNVAELDATRTQEGSREKTEAKKIRLKSRKRSTESTEKISKEIKKYGLLIERFSGERKALADKKTQKEEEGKKLGEIIGSLADTNEKLK
ncbi:hypothetical protein F53441_4591 [Fusarium austroafricanum]|uniref:Uncharacterized protein n=1 Tax=Fusarium austroafricanum TaxID=2364996 RepID=A0A8H4KJY3_9HYPO|nr:hypothetical protein F53441_4591 [Fusarium austroafricanum]